SNQGLEGESTSRNSCRHTVESYEGIRLRNERILIHSPPCFELILSGSTEKNRSIFICPTTLILGIPLKQTIADSEECSVGEVFVRLTRETRVEELIHIRAGIESLPTRTGIHVVSLIRFH